MSVYTTIDSPVGALLAFSDGESITGLYFPQHRRGRVAGPADVADTAARCEPFAQLREQLAQYFAGQRRDVEVPVRFQGSAFSQQIWQALRRIPAGTTVTYAGLAADAGLSPQAARAVGGAVARNPISIVVPCHRVIGTNGMVTGYAGGLDAKRYLLRLEGVTIR